jgi:hypothetical protein
MSSEPTRGDARKRPDQRDRHSTRAGPRSWTRPRRRDRTALRGPRALAGGWSLAAQRAPRVRVRLERAARARALRLGRSRSAAPPAASRGAPLLAHGPRRRRTRQLPTSALCRAYQLERRNSR